MVGTGSKWEQSVVGIMIGVTTEGQLLHQPINLQGLSTESGFQQSLTEILSRINETLDPKRSTLQPNRSSQFSINNRAEGGLPAKKSKNPKVGDHIISHHVGHCYYTASVAKYNASTMEYTVTWDDGDTSSRVQKYNQVG